MGDGTSAGSAIPAGGSGDAICFGPFLFELPRNRLCRDGVDVYLTPKAAAVLGHLLQRPGELITKDEFLDVVWEGVSVREESLTQAISVIRRAIGDPAQSPGFIETISGEGYRFIGSVHGDDAGSDADTDPRIEIETPSAEHAITSTVSGSSAQTRPRGWPRAVPWVIAAAATAVSLFMYLDFPDNGDEDPFYSHILLQQPIGGSLADNSPLAVSPDGTKLIYRFTARGGPLYLHHLTTDVVEPISGTEAAIDGTEAGVRPFFSPDSEWLGFFVRTETGRQMMKVSLADDGGLPIPLCDGPGPSVGWGGASWGPDDRIVYAVGGPVRRGLQEARPDGTGCTALTHLETDKRESSHRWPQMLPNGKGVLFSRWGDYSFDAGDIAVYSFDTGKITKVATGSYARFVPTEGPDDGHLLVARYQQLFAVPFDAGRMQATGPEVLVIDDLFIATMGLSGPAHFTVSDDGRLIYRETVPQHLRALVEVDLQGNETLLAAGDRAYDVARYSPDGERAAFITAQGGVYLLDLEARSRATHVLGPFRDGPRVLAIPRFGVEWHPDGEQLLLHAWGGGPHQLYRFHPGTGTDPIPLPAPSNILFPVAWLQDPERVVYNRSGGNLFGAVEKGLDDGGEEREMTGTSGLQCVVSSDERLIACRNSPVVGRSFDIFLHAYDGTGQFHQVSLDGGFSPLWHPNRRTLYFRGGGSVWAADVADEPTVEAGVPRRLFPDVYFHSGGWQPRAYDISPDGTRFLFIKDLEEPEQTRHFRMVDNFYEVLRRKAPSR